MRPNYFPEKYFDAAPTSKKSTHIAKSKPRKKYSVYDRRGNWVQNTTAVSEIQAVNNVRHNKDGDFNGNDGYYAVEI